ncbi:MAG: hypothetical protein FWC67_02300 [Defluviitaleaceae bacterium]|nr:hypothetical protein [Defluviitaleaceae bacterium]
MMFDIDIEGFAWFNVYLYIYEYGELTCRKDVMSWAVMSTDGANIHWNETLTISAAFDSETNSKTYAFAYDGAQTRPIPIPIGFSGSSARAWGHIEEPVYIDSEQDEQAIVLYVAKFNNSNSMATLGHDIQELLQNPEPLKLYTTTHVIKLIFSNQ